MERMILIAAMVAVTFIPRAIPAALIEKMRFPKKVEKFRTARMCSSVFWEGLPPQCLLT